MAYPIENFGSAPFEIIDGDRGKAYPKQSDFRPSGYCLFLSASNVTKAGFQFESGQFIDEQKDIQLRKGKLQREDVVLTTRGTIGNVAHYNARVPFEHMRINSGMVILRCDQEKILPRYLYAYLRSGLFRKQIDRMRSGVAQPQLPIRDMRRIEIPLPTPSQQQRLVEVIAPYDDLIENSRQRIALLEQAARLLYREWFVHLRFPGHERIKIKDGVPEGWNTKVLSQIASVTMGQSPKSIYYNEEGDGLPFHQGVTNFGDRFPSHRTYCSTPNRIAEAGDILFSVRAPVGRINIANDKIVIGRGLAAIRSKPDQQNLLFYALKNHFFKEDMIGEGSIFSAITKKRLHGVKLLIPSEGTSKEFVDRVRPMDAQIDVLCRTIGALTRARDLLLPRLMNGTIAAAEFKAWNKERVGPQSAEQATLDPAQLSRIGSLS